MPLLVNSVPNLAQGVSQQPDNLRFPGQCDEQINAWATVVEGLVKRPPTNYTKKLNTSNANADKLFTHFVKRSEQNKYCVNVSLGGVGVINLGDGTKVSVAVTSIANTYLSLGGQASLGAVQNPLADLRALTVADYTFLVNRNRTIQKATAVEQKSTPPGGTPSYVSYNNVIYGAIASHTSSTSFDATKWEVSNTVKTADAWTANTVYKGKEHEALIVVKLGDYEKHYTVVIDDVVIPNVNTGTLNHHKIPKLGASDATYESGSSASGYHADTNLIAEDISEIIKGALQIPNDSVLSLNINNGGTGWADGKSTGVWVETWRDATYDVHYKLELEISQSGAGKAYCELIVSNGVITGFRNLRRGRDFDASQNITLTYKQYSKIRRYNASLRDWKLLKPGDYLYKAPPTGFNTSTPSGSSTDPIHVNLQTLGATSYQVEQENSVIKITSTGGPFKIRVKDGLGDQALGVVYREVSSITDLPLQCYNRFGPVKVIGDADVDQDDYYVRFSTKDKGDFGEGSWVETVGYYQDESESSALEGIDTLLASGTMPVTLVPYFNNDRITDFRLQTPNDILYVKQGSSYYRLDVEHRASNTNKPGVGADWQDFWTLVDETSDTNAAVGYLVWKEGTFYYGPKTTTKNIGWAARSAGDDNTNPFPSFVGRTIRDIFFFKNRLGILTDSNIIFSEADEYFNFFRTTTQQLLDSAPIDVGLSHTKVALLENAVPFQEKLMLFSQNSQFVLRGADVLSPKTVAISPVTEYDISDSVQPIALGNYIYFTFKRNNFEGVYEYFVDNNTETFHSEEITQQIPKYITADVRKIAGSQSENTIVVSTTADPKTLFVYKYFWSNKEKIQSAWMKFTFGRDIRGFDFIDSNLHLITADSDGLHLESLTLEDGLRDSGLEYTLCLDSRLDGEEVTVSLYNPATKVTRISDIPYNVSLGNTEIYTKLGNERVITIVDSSTVDVRGAIASYVSYDGSVYKCVTNHTATASDTPDVSPYWSVSTDFTSATLWSAGKFYNNDKYFFIGKPYNMLYRFSDQTLKQPTERGGRSASDYAYQTIRNGRINYADTGHFTVEVTPKYRSKYTYAFNPDSLGANLTLNAFTPQNGHFRFPVQAQPNEAKIEVKSDSALPVKLLGAEFESMFIPRSRRYGA